MKLPRPYAPASKVFAAITLGALACTAAQADRPDAAAARHVLLISVDGMHQTDLERYVAGHPGSAFARLAKRGVTFTNARSAMPSDSFPGLLAFMTGGSPKSHGVFYDDTYDKTLFPPGSDCTGPVGTEAQFAENIDYDLTQLDGGGPAGGNHINPANLPRRKSGALCVPVYPHDYLRTNTIMEVIHEAGGRTAWADKHPAYEIVSGPSGRGLDDLYTPEINSTTVPGQPGVDWTTNPAFTRIYDALKVDAVLHQIHGYDHTGTGRQVGAPAIFGLNFQSVSVAQKVTADGYIDANATPSAELQASLDFVDGSLAKILAALDEEGLAKRTMVIVGAKHGQSPIDVSTLHMLVGSTNPRRPAGHADVTDPADLLSRGGVPVAQETADDVSLIWLQDSSKVKAAVAILEADQQSLNTARIETIYAGERLRERFGNPADGRTPDIIVQPLPGTIYSKSKKKIAEHGGFALDDTHVLLVVSQPGLRPAVVEESVDNRQVGPTILRALGLDPRSLQAVRSEGTRTLPGLEWERDDNR